MFWIRLRRAGRFICLHYLSQTLGIAAGLLVMLVPLPGRAVPIANDTAQPQTSFQVGVESLEQANYPEAIAQFTQALKVNPESVAAFSNRCLAYLQQGDYVHAAQDCTKALELNPEHGEAYLNRGLAHDRMGQFEQAIASYDQLLQRRPNDFRAYYNRGLAQFEQGAYHEAIADYKHSLQQPGLDHIALAEIYRDRGLAKLMLIDQAGAITDFSKAIQFNTADAETHYNRACVYHRQGNLRLAVDDLNQVLAQVSDYAEAYRSRGLIRHQLGEKQQAIADLQQAVKYFSSQGAAIAAQQTLSLIQRLQLSTVALG